MLLTWNVLVSEVGTQRCKNAAGFVKSDRPMVSTHVTSAGTLALGSSLKVGTQCIGRCATAAPAPLPVRIDCFPECGRTDWKKLLPLTIRGPLNNA
jgi:hypothetical protein